MALVTGTKLGRYEIRSQLGAGGMGEVYLARDVQLDRDVALKMLPVDAATNAERMRRFVQEAKAASALNHRNIVTIHEIGEAEAGVFIVMEHVAARTQN
jgi:serine/threonine protein kinase